MRKQPGPSRGLLRDYEPSFQAIVVTLLHPPHLDVAPVPVLGVVDVGAQLGPRHARAHEVVSEVVRLDEAAHQVVLHDPLQLGGVLLELVNTL